MTADGTRIRRLAASDRRTRWARLPAPLVFAAAFGGAMLAQQWAGLPTLPRAWLPVLQGTGALLANLGLLLALWCMALFVRARTTILPSGQASRLVADGPYRISRNPMYVSLALSHAGLALLLDQPWALVTLLLPLAFVHGLQIPYEEAVMRRVFGTRYADYCRRVRRWL